MKAFYSDTFVLPLPEQHRFPMAKYRLLRERLVEERILSAGDLHVPEPIAWDDLRLVHDAAYGGYAPDNDAIVTIHTNTIREAVHSCLSVSAS